MSPGRRRGFAGLLLLAMGLSTFTASVIGIIASFLIEDFGLTRRDIGTIVAINVLAGGLASPAAGRFADRIGSTRAVVVVFALSAAGFAATSIASGLVFLALAGILGGLAQSGANPATNKAIATHVAPGSRGVITGVKQSGVQAAIFAGGVVVPVIAERFGWRAALAGAAVVALAAIPVALAMFPADGARGGEPGSAPAGRALPVAVWWLTGYGFLLGASGAAGVFIPLFAEESLDLGVRAGGLAAAVVGLAAVVGRIAWALYTERRANHVAALGWIAALAAVAAALMLAAPRMGAVWMWLGAVVLGAGSSSWNAVGMLAVIDLVGPAAAGRASGRVLFGFLVGLAVAPGVYGQTVDSTGSYDVMWAASLALGLIALGVTAVWMRRTTS